MPQKKIPLKDRLLVKKRLAQGQSLSEAIKGTSIKSKATAHAISKEEVNDIERLRENYLKLIRAFDAGEIERAELWANMTRATKPIGATILIDKEGKVIKAENEGVIEVPDWANREKALRYIDTLAGIYQEKGTSVAIGVKFTTPEFRRDYEH